MTESEAHPMNTHPTFTASDWYETKGHGWVAAIAGTAGLDPRDLVGQRVTIDNSDYVVKGVETFAIANATGKPFGLLVGDRKAAR